MSHSTINGTAKVQYLGKDLNTVKSERTIKSAIISIVKEDDKNVLYLRIAPGSKSKDFTTSFGFPIIEPRFFDKCINNGMTTIKLEKSYAQVLLSNCPPDLLKLFLTTIRIKIKCNTIPKNISTRQKLSLSMLETVSPVTKKDASKIRSKKLEKHFKNIENISPIAHIKRPIIDSDDELNTPPRQIIRKDSITTRPNSPGMEGVHKKVPLKHTTSTPNNNGRKISDVFKEDKITKPDLKRCKTFDTSLNDSFKLTEYYKLTDEQISILNKVKSGRNIFYTGSAGTGKTFLIKKIIGQLPPDVTYVTASTGVAANLIDGSTLHSFAGLGACPKNLDSALEMVRKKQGLVNQWKKVQHLIVDEISLITAHYFDILDQVARVIRNKVNQPFGGIQMILVGDFLQLPPVIDKFNSIGTDNNYKFAFQSNVWKQHFSDCITELTIVKRQSDKLFIDMLNLIRLGKCPKWVEDKLNETMHQKIEVNNIVATKLCTHKCDVDEMNRCHLMKLNGVERHFDAQDSIQNKADLIKNMCRAETRLTLKIGAQVMLIKNLDMRQGLVNGARGVVVKFADATQFYYPIVKFMNGTEILLKPESFSVNLTINGIRNLIYRKQVPLTLAYALSIHKSQGMTLDCVELYLDKTFEAGQAYVALSRCSSLQSMRVVSWNRRNIYADNHVLQFYNAEQSRQKYEISTNLNL